MNWEMATGLASAVIAACALGLTIWQTRVTREHNRLSVMPYLTTWMHSDKANNFYAIEIINNGIGPALINSFHIYVDGHVIIAEGTDATEKAIKLLFPHHQYSSLQSFVSKGYIMSAKEARNLISLKFHGEELPEAEEFEQTIKRAKVIIEYQSIYKDKLTLDTSSPKNTLEQKSNL